MGAELFHVDGWKDGRTDAQTDAMKLIVAFQNCVKAPKNSKIIITLQEQTCSHNIRVHVPLKTKTEPDSI